MGCKLNVEIKARSSAYEQDRIRQVLKSRKADFRGLDHQVDTYFRANFGRLKLREGKIENNLIHYDREDKEGPKQASVILFRTIPESPLKQILMNSLGVLVVVDKQREIYFIDNVKFHLDSVKDLGSFVEIEAIDENGDASSREKLEKQCRFYRDLFDISEKELVSVSYSDLLLEKNNHSGKGNKSNS